MIQTWRDTDLEAAILDDITLDEPWALGRPPPD